MKKPNIIVFNWHDAGDWFNCYGYQCLETPNIDQLASKGVQFNNNFSACAICSPSRAALMTGQYCQTNGVMGLSNSAMDKRIHPHIPHLAKRLKNEGYSTTLIGIQHEAAHEHVADIMDFDEQIATDPWVHSEVLAHYTQDYIKKQGKNQKPFYLQLGTIDAHLNRFYSGKPAEQKEAYPPLQFKEKGLEKPAYLSDENEDRETVATLQGLLKRGDKLMGAVLNGLKEAGLEKDTLIVMNVDHGVGLDRAKTTCYDPGLKTACLMCWPGVIPAGKKIDNLSTHVDFLPTLSGLLDWDLNDKLPGQDFSKHVLAEAEEELNEYTFAHMVESTRSIRSSRYKLIRNFGPNRHVGQKGSSAYLMKKGGTFLKNRYTQSDSVDPVSVELYDLKNDPNEFINLAGQKTTSTVEAELSDALWQFLIEKNDFIINHPVRNPCHKANFESLINFCKRKNMPQPRQTGPEINKIDEASTRGEIVFD